MQLGYALPQILFKHIADGAPFKAKFGAVVDEEPDKQLLSQKKGRAKNPLT